MISAAALDALSTGPVCCREFEAIKHCVAWREGSTVFPADDETPNVF